MKRRIWMISWSCLALGVALSFWIHPAAWGEAVRQDSSLRITDASPPSSAGAKEPGEGVLSFEVEPDDVEIYLDEHYLGQAGELRKRELTGIIAGNRLLEFKWRGERTFLQVVVPVNGTRTIRVNLEPPASEGS